MLKVFPLNNHCCKMNWTMSLWTEFCSLNIIVLWREPARSPQSPNNDWFTIIVLVIQSGDPKPARQHDFPMSQILSTVPPSGRDPGAASAFHFPFKQPVHFESGPQAKGKG